MNKKITTEKQANLGQALRGLAYLGGGVGGGLFAMKYGPKAIKQVGQGIEKHILNPIGTAWRPIGKHLGANYGKYLAGLGALGVGAATRGRGMRLIPSLLTGGGLAAGGYAWDNAREEDALEEFMMDKHRERVQEEGRYTTETEDPNFLPPEDTLPNYGGGLPSSQYTLPEDLQTLRPGPPPMRP